MQKAANVRSKPRKQPRHSTGKPARQAIAEGAHVSEMRIVIWILLLAWFLLVASSGEELHGKLVQLVACLIEILSFCSRWDGVQ